MDKIDFSNDWVDKSLPYISISQILGLLSEPFDRDGVAQRTFDNNYNNPESKYFNKTKDEIIAMWDAKVTESLRYGKLLDDYIGIVLEGTEDDKEIYELDNDVDGDSRLNGLIVSFNKFLDQIKDRPEIKYVTREKTLYYNSYQKSFVLHHLYQMVLKEDQEFVKYLYKAMTYLPNHLKNLFYSFNA